ncbi:hypothetical protein BS50DRAFT_627620 [Corynespora cassiicola Philippines]|uniref:Uncharacterized protein n=1 Tax=Corynespora cassiicola Philippines TaxID=1448308 RepID=A0A2T2P9G3_CORCC|nr:hypothetical protein BS50DRAFT_627620 [Corynespora cassiicola Philippines]
MSSINRKHDLSEKATPSQPRKQRKTPHDAQSSEDDEYLPDNPNSGSNSELAEDNEDQDENFEIQASSRKATNKKGALKKGKTKHDKAQIEFVIHTRDNNKPDPFGSHSSTTGKLTFAEVAKLYKQKFGGTSGAAAMEKRYRVNKDRYYAEHPTYPRNIQYSGKGLRGPVVPIRPAVSTTPQAQMHGLDARVHARNARDPSRSNRKEPSANARPVGQGRKAIEKYMARIRKNISQHGDLRTYFDDAEPMTESEYEAWAAIYVESSDPPSSVILEVPLEDIRRSSHWYNTHLETKSSVVAQLPGESIETIQRYFQCISPSPALYLPEVDFAVISRELPNGKIEKTAKCSRINWNFETTVNLYVVAVQTQDFHVANLVLNHWRSECRREKELEIDSAYLAKIFENTENDDPGRRFWAHTIATSIDEEEVDEVSEAWPADLVTMVKDFLRGHDAIAPHHRDARRFCVVFHKHDELSPTCLLKQPHQDTGVAEINYPAIARRLRRNAIREYYEELDAESNQEAKLADDDDDDADDESTSDSDEEKELMRWKEKKARLSAKREARANLDMENEEKQQKSRVQLSAEFKSVESLATELERLHTEI